MWNGVMILVGAVFTAAFGAELGLHGSPRKPRLAAVLLSVLLVGVGAYYAAYSVDAGSTERVEGTVTNVDYVFEGCDRGLCAYELTLRYQYEYDGEFYANTDVVYGESDFRLEDPGETTLRSREEAEKWVNTYEPGDDITLYVDPDVPARSGTKRSFLHAKSIELMVVPMLWFAVGGWTLRAVDVFDPLVGTEAGATDD